MDKPLIFLWCFIGAIALYIAYLIGRISVWKIVQRRLRKEDTPND